MRLEPVCFLFGLGVCVSCTHSACEVSFAPVATICNFRFWITAVLNSGGCSYSFESFCVLDDLSAVVFRLHRIRFSDCEEKGGRCRKRGEISLLHLSTTLERAENKGSHRRQSYRPTLHCISAVQHSWCSFHPSSTSEQRLLL